MVPVGPNNLLSPQILTFKEISWQMIRIEADAIQSAEHEMLSAPIRLITNQSKIRVTLKRRVSTHTHTHAHECTPAHLMHTVYLTHPHTHGWVGP